MSLLPLQSVPRMYVPPFSPDVPFILSKYFEKKALIAGLLAAHGTNVSGVWHFIPPHVPVSQGDAGDVRCIARIAQDTAGRQQQQDGGVGGMEHITMLFIRLNVC